MFSLGRHLRLGTAVLAALSTRSPGSRNGAYMESISDKTLLIDIEEVVARLDDAELVALGVGEHNMSLVRALTDVDVAGAQSERPRHRLLLVLQGRAGQIEVNLVLAGLLLLSWQESHPEPGVIVGQERHAVLGVAGNLPAQEKAGPEARQTGADRSASKQSARR